MAKFLGIDFGSKKVGIAMSDEGGTLAFPFKILKNNQELLDQIHNICGEQGISEIIIGESFDYTGKENEIMGKIKNFASQLSRLGLPIHFEKEFMTSIHSDQLKTKNIFSARKIKKIIGKKADDSAAALILQRYLDRNKND